MVSKAKSLYRLCTLFDFHMYGGSMAIAVASTTLVLKGKKINKREREKKIKLAAWIPELNKTAVEWETTVP